MEKDNINLNRKLEVLKSLLKEIHKGGDIGVLKQRFREILKDVKPWEIPFLEQELIKEGVSVFEIIRLCDLHVELFRETLLKHRGLSELPDSRPLLDFIKENQEIIRDAEILDLYLRALNSEKDNILQRL